MDKGLEKINILNIKIEDVIGVLTELDKQIEEKKDELEELETRKYLLKSIDETLNSKKKEIESCMDSIKKAKRNKNIATIGMIIILELFAILLTNIMYTNVSFNMVKYLMLFVNVYIIPLSIFFGDVSDYRGKKKYLKKNKLEEIEKELEKNHGKINVINKQMNIIKNELNILNSNREKIVLEKETLEKEKEEITLIRKDIIEAFIEDNKSLNNLLNSGYNFYLDEKEKNKQLVKE